MFILDEKKGHISRRGVNWVYGYFNTPAKDSMYLEDKRASYFEHIRKTDIYKETNSDR